MNTVRIRRIAALLFVLVTGISGSASPDADLDPLPRWAYHLRVVSVHGAGAEPGAAVGWADDGVRPVVLSEDETWGSPEQLRSLATALGGARADPVAGFFATTDESGVARFDRAVFLGESALDLEFEAFPPAGPGDSRELRLVLHDRDGRDAPLVETTLRARTDRTVAIACPAPVDGDWLVLAVTLLDRDASRGARFVADPYPSITDPGIVEPKIVHKPSPRYPEAARRTGISGHVVVEVILDENGVPHAPLVVSMTEGCEELAASAVDAVATWRWEPATRDGVPVAVAMRVTAAFRLE